MASDSDLQLRTIEAGEVAAWAASAVIPFFESGNDPEGAVAHWGAHLEPERTWVVTDGGRFVANSCVFSRDITLPGAGEAPCPTIPMAAVSGVGVHPTHRRRGLLNAMMSAMLADARERQEPVAGLLASEAAIYGRYGFGVATLNAEYRLDPRRCAFARRPPAVELRLVVMEEAKERLPSLHEVARRRRPGEVSRNAATWQDEWDDPVSRRHGSSAAYRAVTEDGFVSYRIHRHEVDRIEAHQVVVHDLYGATPQIEAALWRFVLDLDLVGEVSAWRRPLDDPLRWWLADPRQARTTSVSDMVWIRVLDVPAALSARRYVREGRLVLEVVDAELGPPGGDPAAGRFVLEAGPDGATCRRAQKVEATDLVLGVAALGTLLLGGVGSRALAAAGRIEEARPGALETADGLFWSPLAPFSGTGF